MGGREIVVLSVVALFGCQLSLGGLGSGSGQAAEAGGSTGSGSIGGSTSPNPATATGGGTADGTSATGLPPLDTGTTTSATNTDASSSGPGSTTRTSDSSTTGSGSTGSGSESSESSGSEIEADLPMLRIELPCMLGNCQFNPADVCFMDPTVLDSDTFTGAPGTTYDVTIRVRGVVEMSSYINGVPDGPVYVGGMVDSFWSAFYLEVSSPGQTYFLNPLGDGDLFTHGMDYSYTLPIEAGATVTLHGGSGDDSCGLFNKDDVGAPIVVPGVPPAPLHFDGQFIQIDAEMIVPS